MTSRGSSTPGPAPVGDPLLLLADLLRAAIRAAFPAADFPQLGPDIDPGIAPCKNPALGDFQSNAAMPLAKKLGMNPREAALRIVAAARSIDAAGLVEPITEAAIAGPGFINIRLREKALAELLASLDEPGLGIVPPLAPETVVVDLMGVNLAKQMHVGHLRSPIIGDAIARTLERLGHNVIRQNHVGDWGLPIAMVVGRLLRQSKAGLIDLNRLTLTDLDAAYKAAQAECQRDAAGLDACHRHDLGPKAVAECEEQVAGATEAFTSARQTLLRLQAKHPETYAVWQKLYDVTMAVCLAACARLKVDVTAAHTAGESSYADELAPMVDDLVSRGVAEESQGALVVRLDERILFEPILPGDPEPELIREPCLVRKGDGGYLYATTDIAAVRRRVHALGAQRVVYVIDARQSLHLRQVFGAARRAGYARHLVGGPTPGRLARLEHAAFGSVLGEDGRPFKTRSGDSVALADLIEETVARATRAVRERSPELPGAEAALVAEAVGTAALKYADLSTDRVKDYLFGFDRMLAFEGNTGPYLLYALVRIRSIFRKAAERAVGETWRAAPAAAHAPAEKALALVLLRYPAVVAATGEALEPHRLCAYLYDLAGAFSTFFDACPVLQAPDVPTRDARLRLCALAARILEDGLTVLGIPTVDRM